MLVEFIITEVIIISILVYLCYRIVKMIDKRPCKCEDVFEFPKVVDSIIKENKDLIEKGEAVIFEPRTELDDIIEGTG